MINCFSCIKPSSSSTKEEAKEEGEILYPCLSIAPFVTKLYISDHDDERIKAFSINVRMSEVSDSHRMDEGSGEGGGGSGYKYN